MNLPVEIVDHILDYRQSMIHFEHMKKIKGNLLQHRNKLIKDVCIRYLEYDVWQKFGFDWKWRYEDAEYYIQVFSSCTCCKRHQEKRPTLQQLDDNFVPEYSTSPVSVNYTGNNCNCACRHLSRHLCREVNDVIMD